MSRVKSKKVVLAIAALAAIGAVPSIASASWSNRVLRNVGLPGLHDPGTWQSHTTFLATNGVRTLDVTVDYAVFSPGQFPGVYTPFAGFVAPGPNDYVYAYQVYNTGLGNGGQSNTPFSQLGIDSVGPVSSLGKDESGVAPLGDPAGINTNLAFLSQDGASYLFLVPAINVDEYSIVLMLASPFAPVFSRASVYDSGLSAHGDLPMPLPAPGALALLGLGLVAARRRR